MRTATSTETHTTPCGNGNLIRTWTDDTEINVQLCTAHGVEMGRAQFTGRDAEGMAIMVATSWAQANR